MSSQMDRVYSSESEAKEESWRRPLEEADMAKCVRASGCRAAPC